MPWKWTYKNILRHNIREAKKQYYTRTRYKDNIQKIWGTIDDTLNRNNSKDNNTVIQDPNELANAFISYVINIG